MNMAFVKADLSPNGKQNITWWPALPVKIKCTVDLHDFVVSSPNCYNENFKNQFAQIIFHILRKSSRIM